MSRHTTRFMPYQGVSYESNYVKLYQGVNYQSTSSQNYLAAYTKNYATTYQGVLYDQTYSKTYQGVAYESTSSQTYQGNYVKTYSNTFDGYRIHCNHDYNFQGPSYTRTETVGYTGGGVNYEGPLQIYSNAPPGELDYGTDPAYFRGQQYQGPGLYAGPFGYQSTSTVDYQRLDSETYQGNYRKTFSGPAYQSTSTTAYQGVNYQSTSSTTYTGNYIGNYLGTTHEPLVVLVPIYLDSGLPTSCCRDIYWKLHSYIPRSVVSINIICGISESCG